MACASKTLPLGLGGGELNGSSFCAWALEFELEAGAASPVVLGSPVAGASRGIGWRVVIVPRRRSSPAHTPQCLSKRDALPEAGCSKRRPMQGSEEQSREHDRLVSEDSLGWKRSRRGCVAPQAPAPSAAPARTPKRDCALVVAGVFLVRASRDSRCPRGGFQSARGREPDHSAGGPPQLQQGRTSTLHRHGLS